MNLTCSSKLIKYLMFVFNFLFVITGIILLGLGVSVKAYYYQYDTFLDNKYFSLPNLLIATGSLIFFISFLGCYGAMKENWIMLMAFSVLLGIIFIFELSAGIAGYALRDKTSSYLEEKLSDNMLKYETSKEVNKMWDIIQDEFECCGVHNYTDWETVFKNSSLPLSCCPRVSGTIGVFYCNANQIPTTVTTPSTVSTPSTVTTPSTVSTPSTKETDPPAKVDADADATTTVPPSTSSPYNVGCESAFGSFIKAHAVDIGGAAIAIAVIQFVGVIFACHLARQLKNGYYST